MGRCSGIFFECLAYQVLRMGLVGVMAVPAFEMIGSYVFKSGFCFTSASEIVSSARGGFLTHSACFFAILGRSWKGALSWPLKYSWWSKCL